MEELCYKKYFYTEESIVKSVIKKTVAYLFMAILALILISMAFGVRAYVVAGWSMQPVIDYMDVIFVNENVDKTNLKVGDIVTFNYGIIDTHRIIQVEYDANNKVVSYTTKGDNPNITKTEKFSPNKIRGKVITISNKPLLLKSLGYTILDIQKNKVLFILYLLAIYAFFWLTPKPRNYVAYDCE